jgi:hypothetical protein
VHQRVGAALVAARSATPCAHGGWTLRMPWVPIPLMKRNLDDILVNRAMTRWGVRREV